MDLHGRADITQEYGCVKDGSRSAKIVLSFPIYLELPKEQYIQIIYFKGIEFIQVGSHRKVGGHYVR